VGEGRAVPGSRLEEIRPFLEDTSRNKAALDLKLTLANLRQAGVEAGGFTEDPVLYNFLLTADPASCTTEALIERRLGRKNTGGVAELADFTLQLTGMLAPEVDQQGFRELYEKIDLPLIDETLHDTVFEDVWQGDEVQAQEDMLCGLALPARGGRVLICKG
jgi:DNA polymerase I-like protein with 3'-5' exonuclease and polymerase domains